MGNKARVLDNDNDGTLHVRHPYITMWSSRGVGVKMIQHALNPHNNKTHAVNKDTAAVINGEAAAENRQIAVKPQIVGVMLIMVCAHTHMPSPANICSQLGLCRVRRGNCRQGSGRAGCRVPPPPTTTPPPPLTIATAAARLAAAESRAGAFLFGQGGLVARVVSGQGDQREPDGNDGHMPGCFHTVEALFGGFPCIHKGDGGNFSNLVQPWNASFEYLSCGGGGAHVVLCNANHQRMRGHHTNCDGFIDCNPHALE